MDRAEIFERLAIYGIERLIVIETASLISDRERPVGGATGD